MPAGKEERGGGGPGGPLGFRLGRKELTPGGKEGEGRREGAEGRSKKAGRKPQPRWEGAVPTSGVRAPGSHQGQQQGQTPHLLLPDGTVPPSLPPSTSLQADNTPQDTAPEHTDTSRPHHGLGSAPRCHPHPRRQVPWGGYVGSKPSRSPCWGNTMRAPPGGLGKPAGFTPAPPDAPHPDLLQHLASASALLTIACGWEGGWQGLQADPKGNGHLCVAFPNTQTTPPSSLPSMHGCPSPLGKHIQRMKSSSAPGRTIRLLSPAGSTPCPPSPAGSNLRDAAGGVQPGAHETRSTGRSQASSSRSAHREDSPG